MKARSVVLTQLEAPVTIVGLPPRMMAASFMIAFLAFLGCTVFGVVALSMILFALLMAIGIAVSYALSRDDVHVETVFITAFGFWGLSSRRSLLAGTSAPSFLKEGCS